MMNSYNPEAMTERAVAEEKGATEKVWELMLAFEDESLKELEGLSTAKLINSIPRTPQLNNKASRIAAAPAKASSGPVGTVLLFNWTLLYF
jgi:hypothetical protein